MTEHDHRSDLIESHSVDFVPPNERHGRVADLFTLWFATNIAPLPVVTGALAVQKMITNSAIFGGTAPCKPATLSEIPIGNVSTLSGILGELFAPARSPTARARTYGPSAIRPTSPPS